MDKGKREERRGWGERQIGNEKQMGSEGVGRRRGGDKM
jgi:hypothetical protein